MKILVLSKKFSFPLNEGEPIATGYLARSLRKEGCVIDLLVMNTSRNPTDPDRLSEGRDIFRKIISVPVNTDITVQGAFASLLQGRSYIAARFFQPVYQDRLRELLREVALEADGGYDIVQLETVYLAAYIPVIRSCTDARISIRSHNVEHRIWARQLSLTKNPLRWAYLAYQQWLLKRFEINRSASADCLLAISTEDLAYFRRAGAAPKASLAASVGIPVEEYHPDPTAFRTRPASVCFIGTLDWQPNKSGIFWFLDTIWPLVSERFPHATFHLAGKNMPSQLLNRKQRNVVIHGEVPDAKAFINHSPILVAPLLSGSGIKIKILEAMALGRVVITTDIGAEGIAAQKGKEIMLANNPLGFVEQLAWCFHHPTALPAIGEAARQFIERNFDSADIAKQVKTLYRQAVGPAGQAR
ncbi:MAG: hypothetical protein RLY31_513 [Bacteroidota bacterium]|jgi:glycosyltransferase involved in cell wall biosynthesis